MSGDGRVVAEAVGQADAHDISRDAHRFWSAGNNIKALVLSKIDIEIFELS